MKIHFTEEEKFKIVIACLICIIVCVLFIGFINTVSDNVNLQSQVWGLVDENKALKKENESLKERIDKYRDEVDKWFQNFIDSSISCTNE